jgi:hypothetical protein
MIDVKNWDGGKNISKIKGKKTSVIKEYLNFLELLLAMFAQNSKAKNIIRFRDSKLQQFQKN